MKKYGFISCWTSFSSPQQKGKAVVFDGRQKLSKKPVCKLQGNIYNALPVWIINNSFFFEMEFMKNVIAALILVLVVVPFAFGQANDWVNFSSKAGNFSVSLPAKPSEEVKNGEFQPYNAKTGAPIGNKLGVTSHMIMTQTASAIYTVGWVDYAAGFQFDTNAEIKANRDSFIKSLNAGLISEKNITLGSNPGLEFTGKREPDVFINARVYIIGKRPYILAVAMRGTEDKQAVNRFFSSFKLATKQTSSAKK